METYVQEKVREIHRTFAVPSTFFVAWQGVMTLAFTGFSEQLLALKRCLNSVPGLATENHGSRWPKVSLGCLRGTIELEKHELRRLVELAEKYGKDLRDSGWRMEVNAVRVVVFGNRQLSTRLFDSEIALVQPVDEAEPTQDEQQRIKDLILKYQKLDDDAIEKLLEGVNKPGGRRSHYEEFHVETTLICQAANLPPAVDEFKKAVDLALPGYYLWFDKDSLHMTIRALNGAK